MPGSVKAAGIWKAFPTANGPLPVIESVDLEVFDGEFVALVGPSGCGKSTLLDIIAGFEHADRGTVTVDGETITAPSRKRILIPQQASVFPWLTARRNLVFVLEGPEQERFATTLEYLEVVGLTAFQLAYPLQLSGGMLKRLELARALAVKPDVLYMDEPFGALDALTRLRLQGELLRLLERERHTCLLVTHDVEEALRLSNRVVVLTERPARVKCIVEVPGSHPRDLTSPEFLRLRALILRELGVEAPVTSAPA